MQAIYRVKFEASGLEREREFMAKSRDDAKKYIERIFGGDAGFRIISITKI